MQADEKGKSKGPAHFVCLVGVGDHRIQHDGEMWPGKEGAIEDFKAFLTNKARELRVSMLAEEFNEEALQKSRAPAATVKFVAQRLGLEHRFCDPNTQERKKLGVSSKDTPQDRDIRERFWLQGLQPFCSKGVLFICGDEHLNDFQTKLREAGIPAEIIGDGWGKGLFDSRNRDFGIPHPVGTD